MEEEQVDQAQQCLYAAQIMLNRGEIDGAKIMLELAMDSSTNEAETQKSQQCFEHFKRELSKVKNSYFGENSLQAQHDENNYNYDGKHNTIKEEKSSHDSEFLMLYNSLLMRAKLFKMGIEVFVSNPHLKPGIDFSEIQFKIYNLINLSRTAFEKGYYNRAEKHMKSADDIYSEATSEKQKYSQNKFPNDGDTVRNKDSFQTKSGGNKESEATLKSYKITVIGDDVDVMKCLKIADTALLAKDFKKAERWLKKCERIQPTDYAKQLLKKLENAKKEANAAAVTIPPSEVTVTVETDKEKCDYSTVTTPQQKAEICLSKALKSIENADLDKAKRLISVAHRIYPEIDSKELELKLKSSESAKSKTHEQAQYDISRQDDVAANIDSLGQVGNNDNSLKSKEFKIALPNYLDANSETAFAHKVYDEHPYHKTRIENNDKAEEYLKKGRMALTKQQFDIAEDHALKSEQLNPSVRAKALIEDIKFAKNSKRQALPNYLDANSDTAFAHKGYDRSSYRTIGNENYDKADEYLMKGRKALTKQSDIAEDHALKAEDHVLKAEDHVLKAEELVPNARCANALVKDTTFATGDKAGDVHNDIRKDTIPKCNTTNTATATQTGSLESLAERSILEFFKEFHKGNLDKAEEILKKTEKLHSNANITKFLDWIADARLKQQLEKQGDNNNSKLDSKDPARQNDNTNKMEVDKQQLGKPIDTMKETYSNITKGVYRNKEKETYKKHNLSTTHIQEQAEQCINEALNECHKGNFDKAQEILIKVKEACPAVEEKVNNYLRDIQNKRLQKQPESDYKSPENEANKDQVIECVKVAQEAFDKGELEKADKFCQKAIRMNSNRENDDIKVLISNICEEKANKITEETRKEPPKEEYNVTKDNISDSTKCIDSAETAFNQKNFDKAERLLQKSIRLHKTDYAKDLLCKVQSEKRKVKERTVNFKNKRDDETEKTSTASGVQKSVEKLINQALEAMEDGHLYAAEQWLNEAEQKQPTEVAKEILKTIQEKIQTKISTSRDISPDSKAKKQERFQKQADEYLALATDMFNIGDYEGARKKVIISDSYAPSSKAKELLNRIIDAQMAQINIIDERTKAPGKAKKGKNKPSLRGGYSESKADKIIRADQCLKLAEDARYAGEWQKALDCVNNSLRIDSQSVKAKKMLFEIQEAMKNSSDGGSRIFKIMKGVKEYFVKK